MSGTRVASYRGSRCGIYQGVVRDNRGFPLWGCTHLHGNASDAIDCADFHMRSQVLS